MSGRYQVCPPLTDAEQSALRVSIRARGVLVPVVVDERGLIIDGHHRAEIAYALGVDFPREVVSDLTEAEKVALAITLNADRRQLDQAQRRALLAKSIKAQPEVSDREHARRVGASDKTAGAVRDEMEGRAEIPHVETRTDSLGRQQPASKPGQPHRDAALDEFLDHDVDVTRARLRANVHRAAVAAGQLADFDVENVAAAVEDDFMETLAWTQRRINDWADAVQKARPRGLRIIGGNK